MTFLSNFREWPRKNLCAIFVIPTLTFRMAFFCPAKEMELDILSVISALAIYM